MNNIYLILIAIKQTLFDYKNFILYPLCFIAFIFYALVLPFLYWVFIFAFFIFTDPILKICFFLILYGFSVLFHIFLLASVIDNYNDLKKLESDKLKRISS